MQAFPISVAAENEEVLQLTDTHQLMGFVLGYVDAHLLASALLSGITLWTEDKKLKENARRLNISTR